MPIPARLFGYDVVSRVGEGAASTIYAVTDQTGQLFALKHVIKQSEADERFIRQLHNEYDVSQKFRHPNLRKVLDWKVPRTFFGNDNNQAALVMEWVEGQGLDEHVPADLPTLLAIFIQAGAALASLHRLRLVHCDFKPHNVLVCGESKIKLIDFGQTCRIGAAKARVQGTPDFITPEQVKCVQVDARTDIYGFGASLYWTLTGKRAPTYFTVEDKDREVVKEQKFPSPRDLKPDVPGRLSETVMQCLSYDPEYRPSDIISVLNVLEEYARGAGTAPPAGR